MTVRDGLLVPPELQRSAHSGRERQAWIESGDLPVGHHTDDAYSAAIDWLRANVADPRFSFEYFDARNDLYNPGGGHSPR